jgi:hypothetical protein
VGGYCRRQNGSLSAQPGRNIFNHDTLAMKYYIWMDVEERLLSKAWPYDDETERMAEEQRTPSVDAVLRAGTREQLIERFGLTEEDFVDKPAIHGS